MRPIDIGWSTTANTRSRFAPTKSPRASPNPGGAYFIARAIGPTNLAEVELNDLLAPWRWQKSESQLSGGELDQFRDLLTQSGWGKGAPQGKILHSRDFYWVASGCRNGQFHFDAWVHAQGDFPEIKFQEFLLARDKTNVAFRPAGQGRTPRSHRAGQAAGALGDDFRADGVRERASAACSTPFERAFDPMVQ